MFERKTKLKTELAGADGVLAKFSKLKTVVQAEVTGPLAAAIKNYQDAQRALSEVEVKKALGEAPDEAVRSAEKRLTAARADIDRLSAKLRGLRGGMAELGTPLAAAHGSLNAVLPEFYSGAKASFETEWAEGIKAYSALLGKRRAIESAIHATMKLPEPQPTAVDIGSDLREPEARLTTIKQALGELRGWRGFDSSTDFQGKPSAPLSASEPVYELRTTEDGLPFGSPVCEASFPPGRLRQLVASNFAVPAATSSTAQPLWDAEQALQGIEADRRQQYTDDAVKRDREQPAFQDHGFTQPYPQLSEEERKRRLDPNNPAYKPVAPQKGPVVIEEEGERQRREREQKKFQAPEPQQAPASQE